MAGLVPGIRVRRAARRSVDGRDKPGHDACERIAPLFGAPLIRGRRASTPGDYRRGWL